MSDYIMTLEGVKKAFAGVTVLDNVDFRLKRGTVHALVGGNGAGKSTLMKILIGVYSHDAGIIKINGEETTIDNYSVANKKGISLIFQELSLVPDMTVYENIFLNRELQKGIIRDVNTMKKKAKEILANLGLDNIDVNAYIRDLSVGRCQLIEIAKALSIDCSILVMDEPTASLSDKETELLFDIIEKLKSNGVSIVYISHRMNEIFRVADEVSVLRNGKMVITEDIKNLDMKKLIDYIIGSSVEKTMEWHDRTVPIGEELLLEVKNLNYKNRLKDVSFKLRKGEVLGFAGLMGSGRTELLHILFGLEKPDSGEIILDGKQVKFRNNKQAIKAGIALVSEDRRREGLILDHTVKDNVVLPNIEAVTHGVVVSPKGMNDMTKKAVSKLNIKTDGIDIPVVSLSGGNQQKVVIAKWLETDPKLLLMDEPTAGVDIEAKGEIVDIVRKLSAQQKSVIFVSSELTELMAICDRIVVLYDGRVTQVLNQEEIVNEEVLQHAIQN